MLINKISQPEWVDLFYGASDLTRTGDLLITSGVLPVLYCIVTFKKVLRQ